MTNATELLHQLKSAAQEEIMCREASDTSDAWQDLASPENILSLIEIALPVLEQQESARQIDNDGWVEWDGGSCPFHDDMQVIEVKFGSGDTVKDFAGTWWWGHSGDDDDIIAYRVIENDGREG